MFPAGGSGLRFASILRDDSIHKIVNSSLLSEHLEQEYGSRLTHTFEPTFPAIAPRNGRPSSTRAQLFVYARPNHARNLFEVTRGAVQRALDVADEGSRFKLVHIVGSGERYWPGLRTPPRCEVLFHPRLTFASYVKILERSSAGLALQFAPHPGYPALELAAAGAMAVTTSYGRKTSLERYSSRIHVVEPDALLLAERLVSLENSSSGGLSDGALLRRSWEEALRHVIDALAGQVESSTR